MTTTAINGPTTGSFSRAVEHAGREEIQAIKLLKMQRQVERLYARNPFYRDHLKAHGFAPEQLRTLDDVRRIPPVTKSMIIGDQDAHPPFGLRLGVDESSVAQIHVTSGTSGQGREVYGLTEADVELMTESSLNMWMWAGLRATDIGTSQVALTNSAAGVCMRPAVMVGGRYMYHVGHLPYGERLDWFQRFGLDGMYGMPSYLATLLGQCQERGLDPRVAFPDFRYYILAGEAYPIAWAQRMEEVWGIQLHETYGSTQTGGTCSAGTCAAGVVPGGERGRMHLFEWTVHYEVLDPETLEHVASGEEGELYVTTMDREASPTLRFKTGDRARWFSYDDAGCGCGMALDAIEAGTVGRLDDMLKIKGVNIWPAAVDEVVLSAPGVEDYRARVTVDDRGRHDVILSVAFTDDADPRVDGVLKALDAELRSKVGITFRVGAVPRSTLDQYEFKARRWTDERMTKMAEG